MAAAQDLLSFVCSGCGTLIGYPPGARLVQCSCCTLISNVQQNESSIQLPCVQCKSVLSFPSHTQMAMCPLCGSVFKIQTVQQQADGSPPVAQPAADAGAATEPPPPERRLSALRPTTPATRTANRDGADQASAVAGEKVTADWGDVWQGKAFSADEVAQQRELEDEFAAVTAQRDTARLLKQRK
eukprot:TRINITY_DN43005_c0_g1_i1.p1 TRINITY_DN43005_c0_g1~~TRINITY_DN43005_c0_g1_i1.p1  ORF type:complete len:207 (+),score=48.19 TRINITY_DN43005_c0_g1_i1:69-623(+)